jgi:hypothetical protein
MPKLLTNGVLPDGHRSPKDEMKGIVQKLTAKRLEKSKARLLMLLEKV